MVLFHEQLSPLFWACNKAEYHGSKRVGEEAQPRAVRQREGMPVLMAPPPPLFVPTGAQAYSMVLPT